MVSRERVDHRPVHHYVVHARIDRWRAGRKPNLGIAGIVWTHRGQHRLMPATGTSHDADCIGACVKLGRMRLEPSHSVIYVGKRTWVRSVWWDAKIQRRHDHAAFRQRLMDRFVHEAVAETPGAAV